jgi:AmmeMemoRadiSam system protein B
MREAKYAGMFYAAGELSLKKQIKECFLSERGPGALPAKPMGPILAVIAPHAGYAYSGACAAWSYKAVAESDFPDLFIIIGPSHHGSASGISMGPFSTPLGVVRVDQDFARKLIEKGTIRENPETHENEHCIEVQLPFLQFIYEKKIEKIKILPLLVSHDIDLKQLAVDLKEIIMDTGKKAVFIISSDFTHYGRNYGYLPFTEHVQKRIYDLDRQAIKYIEEMDPEGFLQFVDEKMMTVCGFLPIALLLMTINPKKVILEHYYTSGDVTKDYKNSVSYASIIFI